MLTRTLDNLDLLIVKNLHRIRQIPFDVVVHLPRSGTIPASLLSTYLCKPLASVEEYIRGIVITRKSDTKPRHIDRILLVDDSIRTGKQMQLAIDRIKSVKPNCDIYTMAVYSTKFDRTLNPTICLDEHNEVMYIYPWFMWKTERIEFCAVDMDGVLCRDCEKSEDDDGYNYGNFLNNTPLKLKPLKHTIGVIVTSRLEKYRPQTEEWLARNDIKYNKLIMGPWKSKAERAGNQAAWKASVYSRMRDLDLFIESSEKEAIEIAKISGKSVWCIDTQKAY